MNDATIALAHALDDSERVRTHALRTVAASSALLVDALHALRHGSAAVTDEFLSRVIDDLDKEREFLRNA